MKIEKVAKFKPVDRFLYWINERHSIYLKRQSGEKRPWTNDEVLQSVFFTNPYRENDKTTVWFRENIREPLRNKPEVLFATVAFRWFNRISTGELLQAHGLFTRWQQAKAVRVLEKARGDGLTVFTGAYMIKAGNGPKGCKIGNVCNAITNVWKQRKRLVQVCEDDCRLEALWDELVQFKYLGGFMSYEIVCDLRYTRLLENASDVCSWTNPGPGCVRGLNRLMGLRGGDLNSRPKNHIGRMQKLMVLVNNKLKMKPRFEMREVEHSLCEWDKYERAKLKDGKLKRKYKGGA